jgi:hypothetical protein
MPLAQETYNAFWALVRKGDFEGIRDLAHPDFELSLPGMPPLRLDAAITTARAWKTGFSDFGDNQQILHAFASADGLHWGAAIRETLRHDGPFNTPTGTISPTFREVPLGSIHLFGVTPDGQMLSWRIEFDATGLVAQLA